MSSTVTVSDRAFRSTDARSSLIHASYVGIGAFGSGAGSSISTTATGDRRANVRSTARVSSGTRWSISTSSVFRVVEIPDEIRSVPGRLRSSFHSRSLSCSSWR